jgi:hypothetical protein
MPRAGSSTELALRSRTVPARSDQSPKAVACSPSRLHPRIALTRLGGARVKVGGAIPLAEPELSLASLHIPWKAVASGPPILGKTNQFDNIPSITVIGSQSIILITLT